MDLKRIIELQQEQLERYKALKMSCDTCIDNEVIEAQVLAIRYLEENLEMKQDLERLETINEVWHKYEPTESVDINAEHLQELYEYIIYANKENSKLNKVKTNIENKIKKFEHMINVAEINGDQNCVWILKMEINLLKEVLGNEKKES